MKPYAYESMNETMKQLDYTAWHVAFDINYGSTNTELTMGIPISRTWLSQDIINKPVKITIIVAKQYKMWQL